MMKMNMTQVIARINELAKIAKTRPLTQDETQERAELRQRYIESVRENLRAQLDNTYVVDPQGNKRKLTEVHSEKNHK
jgi:uncharacterized protein YnzC (UPF0291/DUF896 family)